MTVSANTDSQSWKHIAWNGLEFDVPAGWEPVKIGRNYLMFDDETGPKMEVKWNRVKGSFSHKASLRKLGAAHTRALRKKLAFSQLPSAWQQALGGYEASGFSWQSTTVKGKGVILYCPGCKNATLIQFLQAESALPEALGERILASFADHPANGTVRWSLFDIRVDLPRDMQLKRHRFYTGAFELEFTLNKNTFGLHRWAPANALLQNIGLHGFTEQWAARYCVEKFALQTDGEFALTAVVPQTTPNILRRFLHFRRKAQLQFIRVWHVEDRNRILAVRVDGFRMPDVDLLEHICTNYEIV